MAMPEKDQAARGAWKVVAKQPALVMCPKIVQSQRKLDWQLQVEGWRPRRSVELQKKTDERHHDETLQRQS